MQISIFICIKNIVLYLPQTPEGALNLEPPLGGRGLIFRVITLGVPLLKAAASGYPLQVLAPLKCGAVGFPLLSLTQNTREL